MIIINSLYFLIYIFMEDSNFSFKQYLKFFIYSWNKWKEYLPYFKATSKFVEIFIVILSFILPILLSFYYNEINKIKHYDELEFKDEILKYDLDISEYKNKLNIIDGKIYKINNYFLYFNDSLLEKVDLLKEYNDYIFEKRQENNNIDLTNYKYNDELWIKIYKENLIKELNKIINNQKNIIIKYNSKEKNEDNIIWTKYVVWILLMYLFVLILLFRLSYLTYKIEKLSS